jgi:hypothetical protein
MSEESVQTCGSSRRRLSYTSGEARMSEARVRVSLTDGVLEFEGPETFVSGLVEKFIQVIETALAGDPSGDAKPAAAIGQHVVRAPTAPEVALQDLLAATDTGVQILTTVPGSTKAQRAVNLAKLYLYGLQVLKQRDTAPFSEIGRACKAHGCYHSHNMAAYLKGDRASFVFGGHGKHQTLKLSAPGLEGIAALIERTRAGRHGITPRRQGIAQAAIPTARQAKKSAPIHKETVAT